MVKSDFGSISTIEHIVLYGYALFSHFSGVRLCSEKKERKKKKRQHNIMSSCLNSLGKAANLSTQFTSFLLLLFATGLRERTLRADTFHQFLSNSSQACCRLRCRNAGSIYDPCHTLDMNEREKEKVHEGSPGGHRDRVYFIKRLAFQILLIV